jgi:hypothetical protein
MKKNDVVKVIGPRSDNHIGPTKLEWTTTRNRYLGGLFQVNTVDWFEDNSEMITLRHLPGEIQHQLVHVFDSIWLELIVPADELSQLGLSPKNNEGRKSCYWCPGIILTTKVPCLYGLMDICPVCKR